MVEIVKRLLALGVEIARRADQIVLGIKAELPGDIDDTPRAGDLDNMRIARRLGDRFRIEMLDFCRHVVSPN